MRAIATNAVSIAVVRGAPMGSRVLLLLAMARFASADELARASYAIAIAEAVRLVAGGGIEMWAVRAIGRAAGAAEDSRASSAVALVRLLFGLCGGVVAGAVTYLSGHGGGLLAVISGAFVLAGEGLAISAVYHLAHSTPGRLVPVSIFFAVIGTASGVAALLLGGGSVAVCAVVASTELIASLYLLGQLRVAGVLVPFPGIAKRSLTAMRESLPATAYSGLGAIYSRLDAIALNAFSAAAFASYTVAFRATQPFHFVFGAIALAAYAHQMGHAAQSEGEMRAGFRRLLMLIFAAATGAALLTYAVCALLISYLVPKYLDSLGPLAFLCAVIPFLAVNNVAQYALAGAGRLRAMLGVGTATLVATAVLLWVLVPSQGAQGAAMALLAAQLVNSAVLFLVGARPRPEPVPV